MKCYVQLKTTIYCIKTLLSNNSNTIVEEIRKILSNQEILMLSRIIILDKDDAALKAIHKAKHVEHGLAEISDINFLGLAIKRAFLITSRSEVHNK